MVPPCGLELEKNAPEPAAITTAAALISKDIHRTAALTQMCASVTDTGDS